MTSPTTELPVLPFELEIPQGWIGIEQPREGVVLEVQVEEPVGYAGRMFFEIEPVLPFGMDEAGPMEVLIATRASGLAQHMTDGSILDLALHGERPDDEAAPLAYRATVIFRHGPHLVTAFLWTIPLGPGALVVTGLTDADCIALDAGAFGLMVDSLRLGDRVRPVAPDALPPELPAPDRPRSSRELPAGPAGWADSQSEEGRVLRMLVATDPVDVPAVILSMAAPDGSALNGSDGAQDTGVARHLAALDDLASTMTDAEVQESVITDLAVGEVRHSLVVFRQGEGAFSADVWTSLQDDTLPTIVVIASQYDVDRRIQATDWVASATLEQLGAA